mmetsp:Transcript_15841/g.31837  ORF Transcript_15841/g.31837 Transcript_15841/m.31837 type:complete len:256 (-) Transcript_15841:788-1555(-)
MIGQATPYSLCQRLLPSASLLRRPPWCLDSWRMFTASASSSTRSMVAWSALEEPRARRQLHLISKRSHCVTCLQPRCPLLRRSPSYFAWAPLGWGARSSSSSLLRLASRPTRSMSFTSCRSAHRPSFKRLRLIASSSFRPRTTLRSPPRVHSATAVSIRSVTLSMCRPNASSKTRRRRSPRRSAQSTQPSIRRGASTSLWHLAGGAPPTPPPVSPWRGRISTCRPSSSRHPSLSMCQSRRDRTSSRTSFPLGWGT